ncbi:MAG TPA: hypothetical protein VIQ05_01685 [Tardiphaga sp.]
MLTTVDRVIARLTWKHPMADRQVRAVRDDATQFAAQLLENYKSHLVQRSLCPEPPTKPTAS